MHGKREREGGGGGGEGVTSDILSSLKESHPTHGEENAREGHHKTDGRA